MEAPVNHPLFVEREGTEAPGAPGISPSWCSSDKDLVGTAIGPARLWYTVGHGIVNEVYSPRLDIPQIRDLGFIIADDQGFWVEVKRLGSYDMHLPAPGVPLPTIVHRHPRFELTVRLCPDPERDVLLLDVALSGDDRLRVYVLLAPHLGGTGHDNRAWVDVHCGRRVLYAEQGPFGLALSAVDGDFADAIARGSAGYVGSSDLWQDFAQHGQMRWQYATAGPGNVALGAELPQRARIALAMATSKTAAATLAVAALAQWFDAVLERQTRAWQQWHDEREYRVPPPPLPSTLITAMRTSAMVLKCHRDKTFVGAMVASLSVPWGNTGEERGGYHLVWPRDLVESATALLALGGAEEARNVLRYLIATQTDDGHWQQNQWLGGTPYWQGLQLDETAFPVLLAAALAERGELDGVPVTDMVQRALTFIVLKGPASPQDRWEEDAGVNTFTLAVCIAALIAGAEFLNDVDASIARSVADYWNARLEDWMLARSSRLSQTYGVPGYFVREAPSEIIEGTSDFTRPIPIRNRTDGGDVSADEQVALDFLQLVRLGLRRPDDRWIIASVKVADGLLRSDTPNGPVWHRYNGDGYGEHADGRLFDGVGVGRGWPLLTGERGHYALSAGEDPLPYLNAMTRMASDGGLMPEQVWDGDALPARGLYPGRPSGSAMPLVWAHAEFVKLATSARYSYAFDRPASVWRRYAGQANDAASWIWSEGAPLPSMPSGKRLLLIFERPVTLHWGTDGWGEPSDRRSRVIGLGLHAVTLSATELSGRHSIEFTWRDGQGRWRNEEFLVHITSS